MNILTRIKSSSLLTPISLCLVLLIGSAAIARTMPSVVAIDANCEPDGVLASIRAAVAPNMFWRSQRVAIYNALETLPDQWTKQDARTAENEAKVDEVVAETEALLRKYERPSPFADSERLRKLANEVEAKETKA